MNYYQRIRDLREDKDLNQEDIAKILEIKREQYSRYERGMNMMPIDKYIKLAIFYNVSLDYITGIINEPRQIKEIKK